MQRRLQDYQSPVKLKLAALWAATMFCYAYGDYFGLYVAGTITDMSHGIMGPLGPATPGVLLAVSMMMAIPSVMIFLSLVLPPSLCRWLNVVLGVTYTAIMAVSLPGSPLFYSVLGIVEMTLTSTVALMAWRWPRIDGQGPAA